MCIGMNNVAGVTPQSREGVTARRGVRESSREVPDANEVPYYRDPTYYL